MTKNNPISNQMNGVFLHVSNLKNSVKWYADLLQISVEVDNVVSPVFNLHVSGTTSLTLDDHTFDPEFKRSASSNPIFNFFAPNIEEAYEYVKSKNIPIVREVEWVDDTAWFNIQDPDGNVIMICNC